MWTSLRYEEIKSYPFPQGYAGRDKDPELLYAIGHFTQTVWNDTQYIGYGYSNNPDCAAKGAYTTYIVGSYYPPGNYPFQDDFVKNVLPPKD